MKIAFFETKSSDKKFFESRFAEKNNVTFTNKTINETNLTDLKDLEIATVFIYSEVDKEVLGKLPNLKAIFTMSTGYDHIDLEEAKKRNIVVANIPTYGEHTVAEHTFALILAISRKIIESYKRVKDGNFSPDGLTGFDLKGKTLGVVGVGNIGKNVVTIANGFGMKVLGYQRYPDQELANEYNFELVDLDKLLSESDIITLHIPYNKETHHFINDQKIAKMKDGVILINTSRGGVIDTRALIYYLNSKKIAACGLDVLEEEPILREEAELFYSTNIDSQELMGLLENHFLLKNPNVIITPHNAFNSIESLKRIAEITCENIEAFMKGSPENVVS